MSRRAGKRSRRTRSVQELIRPGSSPMNDMVRHAKLLQRIETEFRALLPPEMGDHVRVANLREGELILATPVAPIGARLRMEAPQIADRLAQRGIRNIHQVTVLVRPFPVETHEEPQPRELSPAAKQALAAMKDNAES